MAVNQYDKRYRPFTDADDTYIKAHFTTRTYKAIGEALGRSKRAIIRRAQYLGLSDKPLTTVDWDANNSAHDHFLRRHYRKPGWSGERLAAYFGCSKKAIYQRAELMGLHTQRRVFTFREDTIIHWLYRHGDPRLVAEHLGITLSTLQKRIEFLNIQPAPTHDGTTTNTTTAQRDNALLWLLQCGLTDHDIALVMQCSAKSLANKLYRLRKRLKADCQEYLIHYK